jgi:hypothetical protein
VLGWAIYISLTGFTMYLEGKLTAPVRMALLALLVSGLMLSHLFRNFIVRRGWLAFSPARAILPVLISSFVLSMVMSNLQLFYSSLVRGNFEIFQQLYSADGVQVVLSWWIVFTIWSVIYFAFHFFEKSRNEEIRNLKLEAMRTEVELNNLKAQLNPHFMFNSMNSIRALVDEDPVLAKQSITKLSNILRNTLIMGRKKFVTLEEELSMVEDYLNLEKIRYEERLHFVKEIDPDVMRLLIPPLIIQTLSENAVKHGISRLQNGGEVKIRIFKNDHELDIRVENTGSLQNPSKSSTGIGISNTKQRLELLYDKKAHFSLFEEYGKVIAEIRIPIEQNLMP